MSQLIRIDEISHSRHQLAMRFSLDDLRFDVTYWYNDVDLKHLERKFGTAAMSKIYFHIMAFEVNKLSSLKPAAIDWGPYSHHCTEAFHTLWQTIIHKVWAQWRFENELPNYVGPTCVNSTASDSIAPLENELQDPEILCFCGGGKDSLVAMKLLENADLSYSSFAYSNSIYGASQPQHQLIERLLAHGKPARRHQLWVYDSFVDSPVLQLYPEYGVRTLAAAETPSSIFAALPIVLQHGYQYLALAHEHSANVGNLVWESTGEEINHQWGKSDEAERLLNDYLRLELISNCSYFSALQPVYDVLIFNLLRNHLEAVPATHSCNVRKPWCCRCPKCAYVWLNYMAYLPTELVNSIFDVNLFDLEENQRWFYQMLGLGKHTPFECIGQIAEVQLAFELCKRKGLTGKAMDMYLREFSSIDLDPIIAKYLSVDQAQMRIPEAIAKKIIPQMHEAAKEAHEYIASCAKQA